MYAKTHTYTSQIDVMWAFVYIPMSIYCCFGSERLFSCLRDNLASQRTKRHSRHFSIYVSPPSASAFAWRQRRDVANIQKIIQTELCFYHFFAFFFAFLLQHHKFRLNFVPFIKLIVLSIDEMPIICLLLAFTIK